MPEELDPMPVEPGPQQQIVTKSAFEPSTGQIRYTASGNELMIIFEAGPDIDWIDGEWDGRTHFVLAGEAVSRPAAGLPETHVIAADTDWMLPDVPEGTLVLIDGEEAGAVDATGLTLSFALAGVWRVDLRPPFPWLEASCEVIVI